MKAKLLFILVLLMFTACFISSKQTINNNEINTNGNLTIDENSSVNAKQEFTNKTPIWNVVEKESEDIDNDGKKDYITLFTYYDDKNTIKRFKIRINESEKVFEFGSPKAFSLNSLSINKIVNMDNGKKGILIKLNSEGETANQDSKNAPPYWFDHSFQVMGYTNGEILTVLDGINQPYNDDNNYKVKYIDDYNVEFYDNATKFYVKYAATLYKSQDDGIKRLKAINDNQFWYISGNYFNVEAQDVNSDGVDEIICSKYIPGLYHADLLGIIDYTFAFINGKYSLSKESLRYDGDSGPHTLKQIDFY